MRLEGGEAQRRGGRINIMRGSSGAELFVLEEKKSNLNLGYGCGVE